MYRPLFYGTITEEGRFQLEPGEKEKLNKFLLSLHGKRVQFTIDRRKKSRTNNQNAYYWGVVVKILGDHFGYNPEEMHEALKFKFLRKRNQRLNDLDTVRSTASLDSIEFEHYVETVRRWAATEHQVVIPSPNEIQLEID